MNIYLQGLTMGLAYVAPIGLQNLFVINSALTQKRGRVYLTALIVIWIGIGLLRSKASLEGGKDVNVPLWRLFTTAFVVTWMNPQALIDGTMMLGAFRASLPQGGDLPFIFGFGSASVLWFLTLSTVVSLLGGRFNEKVLNIINKVCGAVIIFYGCKLLWSFVKLMGWL